MTDPRSPQDEVLERAGCPREACLDVPRKPADEAPGLLDKPQLIARLMRGLAALAVLLLLLDLIYTPHFHSGVESGWGFGFYGIYGFLGLVVLVIGAKALRLLVMRSEDYYDQ